MENQGHLEREESQIEFDVDDGLFWPKGKNARRREWSLSFCREQMNAARLWPPAKCAPGARQSKRSRITTSRVYRALESLREYVDIDPNKRGGVPVIRGTRFKVAQLFAQLSEGDSIDDLVEELELDRDTLTNLLQALSVIVDRPQTNARDPA